MKDPKDPGTLELDFSAAVVTPEIAEAFGMADLPNVVILDPLPAEIPEEEETEEQETPQEPPKVPIAPPDQLPAAKPASQGLRATLRPGLLVSLRTKIHGGVDYDKRMLPTPDQAAQDTASVKRWETTRTIEDPEEWDRAVKARSDARGLIVRTCCYSDFGLLCPDNKEQALDDAIAAARRIIAEHNKGAKRSQISLYIIAGRVAQDDVEATRAIGAEIRETMEAMRVAIGKADPEAIRLEATRARQLAGMLSDAAKDRVDAAVTQARAAARELAKRVVKGGEAAAAVVREIAVDALQAGNFAFLDTSEVQAIAPEMIAAPVVDDQHQEEEANAL